MKILAPLLMLVAGQACAQPAVFQYGIYWNPPQAGQTGGGAVSSFIYPGNLIVLGRPNTPTTFTPADFLTGDASGCYGSSCVYSQRDPVTGYITGNGPAIDDSAGLAALINQKIADTSYSPAGTPSVSASGEIEIDIGRALRGTYYVLCNPVIVNLPGVGGMTINGLHAAMFQAAPVSTCPNVSANLANGMFQAGKGSASPGFSSPFLQRIRFTGLYIDGRGLAPKGIGIFNGSTVIQDSVIINVQGGVGNNNSNIYGHNGGYLQLLPPLFAGNYNTPDQPSLYQVATDYPAHVLFNDDQTHDSSSDGFQFIGCQISCVDIAGATRLSHTHTYGYALSPFKGAGQPLYNFELCDTTTGIDDWYADTSIIAGIWVHQCVGNPGHVLNINNGFALGNMMGAPGAGPLYAILLDHGAQVKIQNNDFQSWITSPVAAFDASQCTTTGGVQTCTGTPNAITSAAVAADVASISSMTDNANANGFAFGSEPTSHGNTQIHGNLYEQFLQFPNAQTGQTAILPGGEVEGIVKFSGTIASYTIQWPPLAVGNNKECVFIDGTITTLTNTSGDSNAIQKDGHANPVLGPCEECGTATSAGWRISGCGASSNSSSAQTLLSGLSACPAASGQFCIQPSGTVAQSP